VKYLDYPLLCYSCVNTVLGQEDHLSVIMCFPSKNDPRKTVVEWRCYASTTWWSPVAFVGKNTFQYVATKGLINLKNLFEEKF
jgi:hypothetical protein